MRLRNKTVISVENLKQKTGIPFQPMEMDLSTLRECFTAGHYRPLTAQDRKTRQYSLLYPSKKNRCGGGCPGSGSFFHLI